MVPDHQEGFKGNLLCKPERNRYRECKRRRGKSKPPCLQARRLSAPGGRIRCSPLQCREQRAARAKAEKGNRNDHIGEVVPLADRKGTHQHHLVGEHSRRHQQKRRFLALDAGGIATSLTTEQHRSTPPLWSRHPLASRCGGQDAGAFQFAFGPPVSGTKATGISSRTWRSRGPLAPLVTSTSI